MRRLPGILLFVLLVLALGSVTGLARVPDGELSPALTDVGKPDELAPSGGAWRFDIPIVFLPDAVAAAHGRSPGPVDSRIDPSEAVARAGQASGSAPVKPSFTPPSGPAIPGPGGGPLAIGGGQTGPSPQDLRRALSEIHQRLGL